MERTVRLIVGILLLVFVWIALGGFRQSMRDFERPRSRVMRAVYSPIVMGLATVACIPLIRLIWRPLPWQRSADVRRWLSLVGGVLFVVGWSLYVWGRVTLGRNFGVSSAAEAPLRPNHVLVTSGPFSLVRHPMYLGVIVATWGLVAIYRTWGVLILAVGFLNLPLRARTEERALAARFGPDWEAYARQVPGFLPRVHTR